MPANGCKTRWQPNTTTEWRRWSGCRCNRSGFTATTTTVHEEPQPQLFFYVKYLTFFYFSLLTLRHLLFLCLSGDLVFIDVERLRLLHSFKTKFVQALVPAFTVSNSVTLEKTKKKKVFPAAQVWTSNTNTLLHVRCRSGAEDSPSWRVCRFQVSWRISCRPIGVWATCPNKRWRLSWICFIRCVFVKQWL